MVKDKGLTGEERTQDIPYEKKTPYDKVKVIPEATT
jgi:hypothetical protein